MTCSKPSARNNLHAALNLPGLLDSESCTTFGATSPDYSAPSACFHAYQKAMGALSFYNGWLVSTFHVFYSLEFVKRAITKPYAICVKSNFAFRPVDKFSLAL